MKGYKYDDDLIVGELAFNFVETHHSGFVGPIGLWEHESCPSCKRMLTKAVRAARRQIPPDKLVWMYCNNCHAIKGTSDGMLPPVFIGFGAKPDWAKWALVVATISLAVSVVALVSVQ